MQAYSLADQSYLAVKPETTENTPVKPNIFIPLVSSDLKTNRNLKADRRMRGVDFETNDLSEGEREQAGSIKIWADPDSLGHILNMTMQKGTTTGDATNGYTHPFTAGSPKSYTIEIPRGNYAQRFFGVKGRDLKFSHEDAKLVADLEVMAAGQFSVASLNGATLGSAVALVLSQAYDLEPNRGLLVGDVITIGVGTANEEDATITSVNANGVGVGFSALANTHADGDIVQLKKQTVSNQVLQRPFYIGDTLVAFAADAAAAVTAAGAKTTSTPVQTLAMEYNNNLARAAMSNYRDAALLLPQVKEATVDIKQIFSNPTQHRAWLETVKQAIAVIMRGANLGSARYQFKFVVHKALLEDNSEPLNVGQFISDEQKFRAAYDDTDGKALTVELVNKTAGTIY